MGAMMKRRVFLGTLLAVPFAAKGKPVPSPKPTKCIPYTWICSGAYLAGGEGYRASIDLDKPVLPPGVQSIEYKWT